jgi:arylsulfatase A-like enzyme
MNALCLVIDRLHSGYLGAYGNGWVDTPAFDRLAAESFLFDQALIDTPELAPLYRSYWQGWHALAGAPPQDRPSLPAMLREAGVHTLLLTDAPAVRKHALAADFNDVIEIKVPLLVGPVEEGEFDKTRLAECFAQIIDRLETAPQPFFLWCHLASLGLVWDAPPEFLQLYTEEEAPDAPRSADVHERFLTDRDADEAVGISRTYAAHVSLLDACLERLHAALLEHPVGRETLLTLTSARGFPLGEHRRVGPCDEALYGELVHVPLLLRFPDGLAASGRSQALVEPADLRPTLLDWWNVREPIASPSGGSLMPIIRGEAANLRDRLIISGRGSELAIRTPAWYLRAADAPELYVKPDDYWEANNVAVRCQEVVECLQDTLLQTEQTLAAGRIADLPPLSDVLIEGLE